MPSFNSKVPENFTGSERLDKYVASIPEGINRSRLKSGVNQVLVNGKKSKLSTKVSAGDEIYLEWEDSVPQDIEAQNIPLNIIYEDSNVTVLNKKQGMVTHPGAGNWEGTLVNALLYHWGRSSIPQNPDADTDSQLKAMRPGIVHRLDKDTSGVIITARNRETEEFLSSQFKNHKSLSKIYICICSGHPPVREGIIKTNIVRDTRDRKKFKAVDLESEGKTAISKFKCIGCYGPYSLMKVKIYTGRTHQIRVHLKFIGCPILGDPIYSKGTKGTTFEGASLMLHAFKLRIHLPDNQEKCFTAKVPLRFKKVIKKLHDSFTKSMPPVTLEQTYRQNPKLQVFTAKKGYGQWQK